MGCRRCRRTWKKDNDEKDRIPLIFITKYAEELDRKAAALSRSIRDLRLKLLPPVFSLHLHHLLAHSLASGSALAVQLNSHSTTREQFTRLVTARNRFARTNSDKGYVSDHEVGVHSNLPYSSAPRNDTQTRLLYLRSAFVVFIKISF
uniref:Uncharacterized protein n=1 Tax=Tarenaya spinosa TaxID=228870 RepID=Q1KUX2_9ROSI|nr:hypothetical protein [Tarenaya spinosa]